MHLVSRAVAVTALSLTLAAPAVAAQASADHRGTSWRALVTMDGGKVQACKVATTTTGPWKVKLRVNASSATTKLRGSATVFKGSHATAQTWSSGWVAKGHVSDVGTVKLTRGSAYSLSVGLSASQAGTGGTFTAGDIVHC
jgi:hypothetical protein